MQKFVVLPALLLAGCNFLTDNKNATRILTENGYTDIHNTRVQLFRLLEGRHVSHRYTGLTAKSPNGMPVRETVCAGFHRCTVTYIRRQGRWLALAEHIVKVPPAK
jgi:hypothetical protein